MTSPKTGARIGRILAFGAAVMAAGCHDVPVLQPKGPVGTAEQYVIGISLGLMLLVVIPAIFLNVWFRHRYSARRPKGDYTPDWTYSARIDVAIWVVPMFIVAGLAMVSVKESHDVDPARPLDPLVKPLTVQVIALDWKWLFIYPKQGLATASQLFIPADTPIRFRLTSDSVVTSFFIPRLGSQVYAMPGRKSTLHLIADGPGEYFGENEQFSGKYYSEMWFKVHVLPKDKFAAWAESAARGPLKLDIKRFQLLRAPSRGYPAVTYSTVSFPVFEDVASKYQTVKNLSSNTFSKSKGSRHE